MRRLAVAVVGALCVLAGIALVTVVADTPPDRIVEDAVAVIVLVGAAIALWKVGRSLPEDGDVAIPPWAPGGAIVLGEPERTPREHPLSATALSEVVSTAGETARREGTVEDGLAVLAPPLRDALFDALVQGGMDRAAAERAIDSGEWTDDEWAAYVVEPSVGAPPWTLRQRFRAWLFPEDTVRRLAQVGVHGVARTADEAIPAVPGQDAPRTVPVATPSLADLQRGADGELQEAIEPTAIVRGPAPPSAHHGLDEGLDAGDDEKPLDGRDGESHVGREGVDVEQDEDSRVGREGVDVGQDQPRRDGPDDEEAAGR